MSKVYFITKLFILILFITSLIAVVNTANAEKKPIIITSKTLVTDNKTSTAVFEGSVVAKTDDLVIYSDKMTVFYDNSNEKISKIYASGNVKVHKRERAIFSNEATYYGEEEKIVFAGEPRAIDGENIVSGTQIIYFLKDDRSIVEGSKVILKNKKEAGR
ncbi:MAG: lipopolysaccharide transport periplasmic protein LptA [Nitrospirae bacterium]|nr:lipopolysaccharide transport periplasmic protein LptA [Nitrospirota bacterium]